jgi:hypothetical protein
LLFGTQVVPGILQNFSQNGDGFEINWDGLMESHERPLTLISVAAVYF